MTATQQVMVDVEGVMEEVMLDPERGPILIERDGSQMYAMLNYAQADYSGRHTTRIEKTWTYLTSTERTVFLHMVAKKNKRTRDPHSVWNHSWGEWLVWSETDLDAPVDSGCSLSLQTSKFYSEMTRKELDLFQIFGKYQTSS